MPSTSDSAPLRYQIRADELAAEIDAGRLFCVLQVPDRDAVITKMALEALALRGVILPEKPPCANGCMRKVKGRGLCAACYTRAYKGGDIAVRRQQPVNHGSETGYQKHKTDRAGEWAWPVPDDDSCGCREAHRVYEAHRRSSSR